MAQHGLGGHESDDGDVVYAGTYPAGSTPSNSQIAVIHPEVQPGNETHQFLCSQLDHYVQQNCRLRAQIAELCRKTGRAPSQNGTEAEKVIEGLEADVAYWKNRALSAENALDQQASQAASPSNI